MVLAHSLQIYLVRREEVNWPFVILHLDVLVVADQIASLGQLERVPHVAHWTGQLALCDIALFLVSDARLVHAMSDALLTEAVTAVKDSWKIVLSILLIGVSVLLVADNTSSQVSFD
jgi:hypothetical protein